ncbi:MAG TPA: SEC-C metal-binding domain-containing protein, partial [Thermoanaerobaculia bacterium]
ELNAELFDFFGVDLKSAGVDIHAMRTDDIKQRVVEAVNRRYEEKESKVGAEVMRIHEKYLLLQVIDQQWKDHLLAIDHLKEGIGLRGYGQRDPLIEYKKESFDLFQEMMERIQDRVVKILWKVDVVVEHEGEQRPSRRPLPAPPKQQPMFFSGSGPAQPQTVKHKEQKVGRNDPCPCGSGKKYKKCHGAAA